MRGSPSRNATGTLTSPNPSRPSRRSGLWCRVQALRNRIYRTTRNVNVLERNDGTTTQISSPRPASTVPLNRRHTLRNSILGTSRPENRRSGIFGPSNNHVPSRPLSFHPRQDPFVDDIDARYDHIDEERPRRRHSVVPIPDPSPPPSANLRRRSIWGQPSSPSALRPPLSISPSTLPSVIDHSTQTTGPTHHPLHPFNITRRPGEDQAEMLSRFLYVAGAALAASLVGSTDSTSAQLQDFSNDFADSSDEVATPEAPEGSFEGFLRALRLGRSQFAHALRSDSDVEGANGSGFTYLLMYRFNARVSPNTTATVSESPVSETMDVEPTLSSPEQTTEPSTSTNSESPETTTESRMVPFVIIGVQPVPPRDTGRTGPPSFSEGVASLLANARQTTDNTIPPLRPTTSIGSVTSDTTTVQSTTSIPTSATTIPGSWRDSPAPPDLPRRRASVDGSFRHSLATAGTNSTPTQTESREREATTRAWQMYIYGGAYPENHLIFTAPTLFTDTPSSEDMLLLASILGEAKPPVASKEDIEAAGGISRVGDEGTKIDEGDRCLVCLSEYEQNEECRTLSGCGHLFHRECIDQVSHVRYWTNEVARFREECMSSLSWCWRCDEGIKTNRYTINVPTNRRRTRSWR